MSLDFVIGTGYFAMSRLQSAAVMLHVSRMSIVSQVAEPIRISCQFNADSVKAKAAKAAFCGQGDVRDRRPTMGGTIFRNQRWPMALTPTRPTRTT